MLLSLGKGENQMAFHELKTDSEAFKPVLKGKKTFEIRFNDRNFQVGDFLLLKETQFSDAEMKLGERLEYTGANCLVKVTHVLLGPIYGLQEGWCILSVKLKK